MSTPSNDLVDYWEFIIEEQKQNGLSKAKFCDENGIKRQSFFKWQKYFQKPNDNSAESFIEAEVTTPEVSRTGVTLKLSNGLSLELTLDFDDNVLRRFLAVAATL